ncbi:MAG: biotin transporter BioY [Hyphomicrobiales bacterium]|nr:biotin transporter BioY [Hyphomicrobiales bacterium]
MGTSNLTLAGRLWPTSSLNWTRTILLAIIGSMIVAISAQVSVPMMPVPMTLQTLAVLAVGAAYGARLGAVTLALYALEGAAGLPVFANFQAGLFLPTGEIIATGGFIIGFIVAAALVGHLVEKGWGANIVKLCGAMLLGAVIIYVPGLIWLVGWLIVMKGMVITSAIPAAFSSGVLPFIIGDIVKAILAALAFPAAFSLLGRR